MENSSKDKDEDRINRNLKYLFQSRAHK